MGKGKEVKCAVTKKALDNFKARIRQLTRRMGGRSMAQVVEKLRSYLLGWKAYFGLAQTPHVWRELCEWLRHRLRVGIPGDRDRSFRRIVPDDSGLS